MTRASEANRGAKIRGTVRLIEALVQGQKLSGVGAAAILGGGRAAADRQLREIRKMKGMRNENGATFFDKALLFDPASYSAVVSACLMAGLGRLFRGTSYETGMSAALQIVVDRHVRGLNMQ